MNLGYACINMTLGKTATTNRGMVKRTLLAKGPDWVSELTLLNVKDIIKILEWNREAGIRLFRLSSALIPWGDSVDIDKLKDYEEIQAELRKAGDFARLHNMRITTHPGPFNVLVSPSGAVVEKTIKDLEMHGKIFDMMGLDRSPWNKINIHCNGVYGDKKSAMDRFCQNFSRLSESVRSRLTVENDDKASMYSVMDLQYLWRKIGTPIVFDYHHHGFCDGGLTEQQALELAMSTWPDGMEPVVHYSESKRLHEGDESIKPQAHSDLIHALPNLYGNEVAVMVEAKSKELAILPFIPNSQLLKNIYL